MFPFRVIFEKSDAIWILNSLLPHLKLIELCDFTELDTH